MTTTEGASLRYANLEEWSSSELVAGILEGQYAAIAAVQAASTHIADAINLGAERLARGGRLIYMGAGTSGRIATQDAAELPPTFNWPYERAVTLMAGELDSVGIGADDVVIALAASGRTPYAIAGLSMLARKAR